MKNKYLEIIDEATPKLKLRNLLKAFLSRKGLELYKNEYSSYQIRKDLGFFQGVDELADVYFYDEKIERICLYETT